MIGVLSHKFMDGCGSIEGEENLRFFQNNCMDAMTLEEMLTTTFRTDAHFCCYSVTDFPMWPRLKKSILPEIRQNNLDVVLSYFAFDWDNAEHTDWTDASLTEFAAKIAQCTDPVLSQWSVIYTTKHGARLVYTLSKAVPVDEGEKHLAWMLHRFDESGFTNIDNSCKDWTRVFRCPQVMRDGIASWEQSYYSLLTSPAVLDINAVGKRSVATIPKKTYFTRESQETPDYGTLENLLFAVNKETGKTVQTEFYKRAKRHLKDSIYFDMLFNDAAPDWIQGQRNDQILRMLGFITPILLKKCAASVQQVFALAIHPLLTLDNDQDWVKHGWNALLDIYEREVNLYNVEKEVAANQVAKEIDLLDSMREGMKIWDKHPTLLGSDEEASREYTRKNVICSADGYFFLMGKTGFYEPFPVGRDQLISRIRKTYLSTIIPTTRLGFNGEETDVSASTLQNDYSTPVADIIMKPVGEHGGFIENINGDKPALVLSTFSRNDRLEPTFDPFVDEWLKNLFGLEYEKGCLWIANSLAFDEGLICALSLEGASASGKKLLTVGLSECLKDCPFPAGPEDVYGQSSAFLRTPFLVINESWPARRGLATPADVFKSLTGGDGIRVNEKYRPAMTILCPVRMILTANDDGIIRELTKGKDMTLDNRIAVGERLFHVKVSVKAKLFLESIGGRNFTAAKGQRWIRPDSGNEPSDFIVAKHFLWLYKNRTKVNASQRFLVMGNSAPGAGEGEQTIFEKLLADNNCTPLVALAIIEMVDSKRNTSFMQYVRTNTEMTRLWVTRYGVHKYVREILEERVQERDVFSGMLNLLASNEPAEFENAHWYEISIETLAMIATERGIAQTYIRNMLINKMAQQGAAV